MTFYSELPESGQNLRSRVFAGDVFLARGGRASQDLVLNVIRDMQDELETDDIRKAHLKWSPGELFERFGNLRRHFYLNESYHQRIRDIGEECGLSASRIAFDPIRIRVVLPGGHNNPKAAPVYFPHRDTWYAHPQSLIVWWIPLHALRNEETFEFFPNDFDREVLNDSETFDYGDWVKDGPALKIGWQKEDSGTTGGYPKATDEPDRKNASGFSCNAADQLIFAGAHYHKTLPQNFDTIRYSLDFRVVHLDDVASEVGAPNVDNRSRGSTFVDYMKPTDFPA